MASEINDQKLKAKLTTQLKKNNQMQIDKEINKNIKTVTPPESNDYR